MDVGKFFSTLVRNNSYWYTPIVWAILSTFAYFLDASWGIYVGLTVISLAVYWVLVGVAESGRMSDARWNDRYSDAKPDLFAFIAIPLMMIGLNYPLAISPMIHDYKTADRIDKVLPMDKNVTVFYNDSNSIFILFVEGRKQPLIINRSGNSESYNKLKAGYLDNQIKVVKKETKGWTEDNSSISYHFDDYTFD